MPCQKRRAFDEACNVAEASNEDRVSEQTRPRVLVLKYHRERVDDVVEQHRHT